MGALHRGHLELVQRAKASCDKVVVSIFVNPLQFNNPEDFKKYPSTLLHDLEQLEITGVDVVFTPKTEVIYPSGDILIDFDTAPWDGLMEGKYRPGHFLGVAKVVYRLFEMVQPNKSFFGEKDFQQLSLVKKLAEKFFPTIQIIGVPTIRSDKGVALSSRNMRLSVDEIETLEKIYQKLNILIHQQPENHETLEKKAVEKMEQLGLKVEYVEIRSEVDLKKKSEGGNPPFRLFWAGYLRDVRLIDNLKI